MNNHGFDIVLRISEKPLSSHNIHHNKNKVEDCFELKGIHHDEPNPEDSLNLIKIRNIEIAHKLFLKPRQPDGLNFR